MTQKFFLQNRFKGINYLINLLITSEHSSHAIQETLEMILLQLWQPDKMVSTFNNHIVVSISLQDYININNKNYSQRSHWMRKLGVGEEGGDFFRVRGNLRAQCGMQFHLMMTSYLGIRWKLLWDITVRIKWCIKKLYYELDLL